MDCHQSTTPKCNNHPEVLKPSPSPTVKKPQSPSTPEPILRLRFSADTEYHVVWAKKSLWQRRMEGMQKRHDSSKDLMGEESYESSSSDEEEDDSTFLMDGSSSTFHHQPVTHDRWGEGSTCSLPVITRLEDDSIRSEEDDDHGWQSCPQFDRWESAGSASGASVKTTAATTSEATSADQPAAMPSRRASLLDESSKQNRSTDDDEDDEEEEEESGFNIPWLEGLYDTVREIRTKRAAMS